MAQASGIHRVRGVIEILKCRKVGVAPWFFRIKNIPDDEADVCVAEIHANVGGKIFDTWVNSLSVDHLWKRETGKTRKVILSLGGDH